MGGALPPVVAVTWRGRVAEARIRAHAAVVDRDGRLLAVLGDPDLVVPLRSCVKPLQALAFLRIAADEIGAGEQEVAVACGSHAGQPQHERTVLRLLARVGLGEDALACGPQLPFDPAAANARIAAGLPPRRIDNNCSGKHAGMLAAAVVAGWPVEGYERPGHPVQLAVADAMGPHLGIDLRAAPSGVDGCGLPTFGVSLRDLGRGFARAQDDPAFRRAQEAMASQAEMVAGRGRFDTELLAAAGARVTAKSGGAAVWAACLRPSGPGIALKVESGGEGQIAPVALALLRRLGLTPAGDGLAPFERPLLRNWAGDVVGENRVEEAVLDAAFDSRPPAS